MCYFGVLMRCPDEVADTIAHYLQHPKLGKVDLVVGIGLSGTMALVPVMQRSGVPICAVRKKGVSSHTCGSLEMSGVGFWGDTSPQRRYVILDDFAASGETLKGLRKRLKELRPKWECVGVLLYAHRPNSEPAILGDIPEFCLQNEVEELHELRAEC